MMQPRRWGRWVLLAIVVVFIFKNPGQAAHMAHSAWSLIGQAADSVSRFASGL
jgi:hypothetical protein